MKSLAAQYGDVQPLSEDDIITLLKASPRDWVLVPFADQSWLRRRHGKTFAGACPITALKIGDIDNPSPYADAETLVTDRPTMYRIIRAADRRVGHDPKLRSRMLKACDLKESP